MLNQQGKRVITCPSPNESEQCKKNHPTCRVIEKADLGTLAALCAKADFILSNDSGPMHIATAVNPNTCGIFGVTDPTLTRPWAAN